MSGTRRRARRRAVLLFAAVALVGAGALRARAPEAVPPRDPARRPAPHDRGAGATRAESQPPDPSGPLSPESRFEANLPAARAAAAMAARPDAAVDSGALLSNLHDTIQDEARPPRASAVGGCGAPHSPSPESVPSPPAAGTTPPVTPIKRSTFFDWTPALTGAPLDPGAIPEDDCLGAFPDKPVWSGRVPASTIPVDVEVTPGTYIVVARGRFRFSGTGHQDAMRRWHEPFAPASSVSRFEPKCTGCDFDPSFRTWSFLVNDAVPEFLRECPFRHASAHLARTHRDRLTLQIRDNITDDNAGDLEITVHAVAEADPRAGAEPPGQRLGHAVGARVGQKDLDSFVSEVAWDAEGEAFLVELTGLGATAPGVEQDALYRWDFRNGQAHPAALVEFRCREVRPVAMRPVAHRYLVAVSDCGGPLAARLAPQTEILGRIRMSAFTRPDEAGR